MSGLPVLVSPSDVVTGVLLVAFAFVVTLLHFVMEPLRWRLSYLPAHGDGEVWQRVRDSLYCTALATYLLPFKLGVPLRITLLRRSARLNLRFIGIVIALDGLIGLIAWSVVTATSIWIAALHWQPPVYVWALGVAAVFVVFASVAVKTRFGRRWSDHWHDVFTLLEHPWRRSCTAGLILVVDVVSYGVRHAFLVMLVAGNVSLVLTAGAIGIVATFAGIVSGLPMGLVGYDATLIAMLTAAGLPVDRAILVALINRCLNFGAAALLGLPAAMRLGLGSGVLSIFRRLRELTHDEK